MAESIIQFALHLQPVQNLGREHGLVLRLNKMIITDEAGGHSCYSRIYSTVAKTRSFC